MSDVGLGTAKPKPKKAKQPKRRVPLPPPELTDDERFEEDYGPNRYEAAEPIDSKTGQEAIPDDLAGAPAMPEAPVNPYAPTGWRKKQRVEFDLELPSGQLCRVMRLERDDLLRLNLMEHLDTFTPMLLDNSMSDEARQEMAAQTVKDDPAALSKMLKAVDKVVLSACVKPKITEDPKRVNYGTEKDWANPDWVGTVHIDDIDTFERMFIFGAAFGRSMDDLKSILEQAEGLDGLADVPVVPQTTQ